MALLSWETSYSVHIKDIDQQHQQILDCMVAIDRTLADSGAPKDVETFINALETCCKMHFFDEERLMERRRFPTIAEHKIQHDLFIQRLGRMKSGDASLRSSNELIMLRNWFVNHILSEDMRYAEFFMKKD